MIELTPYAAVQGTLAGIDPSRLTMELLDSHNQVRFALSEHQPQELPLPEVAVTLHAGAISSVDEAWFIGASIWSSITHASRFPPFDYYLRGIELDPQDYRCNLALAMLEYNRADYSQTIEYASRALSRAHRLNKNPQCGRGKFDSCQCERASTAVAQCAGGFLARGVERQWQEPRGYYGLATGDAQRRYDDALAFCRQSLLACPTNQDVLSLETLLLHPAGRRSQALQQIEKLLGDYPLNPTLRWLNATISRTEADTARWFAVCQSRDINALLTAGLLLSWGMAARAKAVLTALNCQKTLPLYLQASLAEGNERIALINRAREVFADFVRFPNLLVMAALEALANHYFAQHLLACFHYSRRHYEKATQLWHRCVEMAPDFADAWRGAGDSCME